jgi:4-hydroxy-tetrahydrodipicolinate synthase
MNLKKIKGTGVALVTPFHKDGSIDFSALQKIVNHIIKGGAEYLVVMGTTGESATLSKDEKAAILDFVVEINQKRVPIVYGVGGNNTNEIGKQLQELDSQNIDAVLSVSPYYNKPSQRGIIQHFKTIARSSPVPIILYNVPGRTCSNMLAETTLTLANEVDTIIGIKEASGNIEQIMQIIKHKPKNFLVISGDDALTFPLIAAGAEGVISVVANAFPKLFSEMVRLAMTGVMDKARIMHYQLLNLIPLLFAEGSPAGIKYVLSQKELCQDYFRLPIVPIGKTLQHKIMEELKNIK